MCELFNIPKENLCGVYEIVNMRTNRKYIGSSCELRTRAVTHLREIKRGKHSNKNINSDIEKNDDFIFRIIHVVENGSPYETTTRTKIRFLEYEEIKKRIERGEFLYNSETTPLIIARLENSRKKLERKEEDCKKENLRKQFLSNPKKFIEDRIDTFKSDDLHKIFEALEVNAEVTYTDKKTGKEIFKSKI